MSYPKTVTVGSLLQFLAEELAKGNVDARTRVFVEVYSLTPEEEQLKARQTELTDEAQKAGKTPAEIEALLESEKLDYHIPDDNMDDVVNFRMGVWQGFPDGQCRDSEGKFENTMALSIYVRKQAEPLRGGRESKEKD